LDKKNGTWSGEVTNMRGISVSRQIDGIKLTGGPGFSIQFASHAKVFQLEMLWRNFQPSKEYKVASPTELIAKIMAGLAVKPVATEEDVSKAKKLTVTKITPFYQNRIAAEPQEMLWPMATLELLADMKDSTNRVFFYLNCPIIDVPAKTKGD